MLRPFFRPAVLAGLAIVLGGGAAQAAVCVRPGFPVGCTVGVGAAGAGVGAPGVGVRPAAGPVDGPVANPTPGVGYGALGAGVRPAAGPNVGRPVNRPGVR